MPGIQDVINYAASAESLFEMKADLDWLKRHGKGSTPEALSLQQSIEQLTPTVGSIDNLASGFVGELESRAAQLGFAPPKKVSEEIRKICENTPDLTQVVSGATNFREAATAVAKTIILPALMKAGQIKDAMTVMTMVPQTASIVEPERYRRKHGV